MTAQRYKDATARDRLARQVCPECGEKADVHSPDNRFWIPRRCDLTVEGVWDRINQFIDDAVVYAWTGVHPNPPTKHIK